MAKRSHHGEGGRWDEGEGFEGGEEEREGKRHKRTPRKKEKETEGRPFAESPVLTSHRAAAGEAVPSSPAGKRRGEEERIEKKDTVAAAKPEAGERPPERRSRGPRQRKEAEETEEQKKKREREEQIRAIYKSLKDSGTTYGDVLTYMREYRAYPLEARVEAAKKLLDDIQSGKITPEILKKAKEGPPEEFVEVALGHEKRLKEPRRKRGKGPREGIFYKDGQTERPALIEIDKLEEGMAEEVEGERGEKGARYHEGARWSWDEWYNFLLRQYAARPEFAKKKIEDFFEKHKEDHEKYSTEAFRAHERLLDELLAEKEGRELGEIFKVREERATGGEKGKLSDEAIDEISLHFREYLQNLPLPEGKTILERLDEVQMSEFESMLGENISMEDILQRAAEIVSKENIKSEDAKVRAENELTTEAAKKFFALRELVVHHRGGWDPKRGFCMGSYSDLDGQGALGLFAKAGIDVKKGAYVSPGYRRLGALNIDTNQADGIFSEVEKKVDPKTGEITFVETWNKDHHGIWSDRATSATKKTFEVFKKFGLLKFENEKEQRAWEKTVEFVTQIDNYTFPGVKGGEFYKTKKGSESSGKEIYETSDRRLIGYAAGMPFDKILQFFIDQEEEPTHLQKTPVSELTGPELGRYGLSIDKEEKRREKIKRDLETVEKLIKDGWVVTMKNGKRLVVDIGDKMGRDGQWAAGSQGFDGILRYHPEDHSFTVALNEGYFDNSTQEILKSLPQGILIRGSFFYKPAAEKVMGGSEEEMSERTKEMLERVRGELLVTLSDLMETVIDPKKKNELGKDLKEFLEKEREEGKLISAHLFRRQEVELPVVDKDGKSRAKIIPAHWRASTSDGTPVRVENVPDDFVSGERGLVRLKDKKKVILKGRDIELAGFEWSGDREEQQKVEVWIGEWEKEKFPEPTPEERELEETKRKIAESIGEEIETLRKKLYRDPNYADVPGRVIEDYLKKFGEELWQKLVKTPSK